MAFKAEYFAEFKTDKVLREQFFPDFSYTGTVVEVGGATPLHYSMSRHWVLNGWRAIIIEPNPHFAQLHRAIGNEVFECACSDKDNNHAEFIVVGPPRHAVPDHCLTEHSYSSLGIKPNYLAYGGKRSVDEFEHTRITVKVRRLDAILNEANVRNIDILSVDVEGWELEVMRGLDLRRYKPTVVILENIDENPLYAEYMRGFGYEIALTLRYNYVFRELESYSPSTVLNQGAMAIENNSSIATHVTPLLPEMIRLDSIRNAAMTNEYQFLQPVRNALIRTVGQQSESGANPVRRTGSEAAQTTGKIAVTHPGKIGDALYALPVIRWLSEQHSCQVDLYTSEYCRPMESLMRQQSCIDRVVVPESYVMEHFKCGAQPWKMPTDEGYDAVYHLGFRSKPDRRLVDWMSASVGGPKGLPVRFEFEQLALRLPKQYAVIAPRGQHRFTELFRQVIQQCPMDIVQIGAPGEAIPGIGIDRTGADFVETCNILSGAMAFFGLMSSQLVLANGFRLPKIVPYKGRRELRCVEHFPGNIYLNPATVDDFLNAAGLTMQFNKALEEADCSLTTSCQHVDNMRRVLSTTPYRYDHYWRRWEYGMCLAALRSVDARSVLDVGGGGSLFAPAIAWLNASVTIVDPASCAEMVKAQSIACQKRMDYIQSEFAAEAIPGTFDAVTSISVIEHVEDDLSFIRGLASKVAPGGVLCLTTDFDPSGKARCKGHLRT